MRPLQNDSHSQPEGFPGDDRVRRRAYQLWQEDGCPVDRDMEYWLRAEAMEKRDRDADEQEEESFPASDPPSRGEIG